MSTHDDLDLPPLDPDVAAHIASVRKGVAVPDDARASLERLLAAQLAPPAATSSSSSSSHGSSGSSASIARIARALGVFVAGGAAGVALHAAVARTPAPEVKTIEHVVSVTVVASAPSAPPSVSIVESASIAPSAPPIAITKSAPSPSVSSSAPIGPDAELARERALIEVERAALARGDPSSALAAAAAHAKEFPAGQMSEQREALAIQALVLAGRYDEARVRAAKFHAAFPHGLFGPVVDAALAKIP